MVTTREQKQITPARIMETATAFFASKTLLSAVKLGVFTTLSGNQSLSGKEIQKAIKLHDRSVYDFLDALVALGFLNRQGLLETATYSNAPETELFLDKNKPSYIGGFVEMANDRLYLFGEIWMKPCLRANPRMRSSTQAGQCLTSFTPNRSV